MRRKYPISPKQKLEILAAYKASGKSKNCFYHEDLSELLADLAPSILMPSRGTFYGWLSDTSIAEAMEAEAQEEQAAVSESLQQDESYGAAALSSQDAISSPTDDNQGVSLPPESVHSIALDGDNPLSDAGTQCSETADNFPIGDELIPEGMRLSDEQGPTLDDLAIIAKKKVRIFGLDQAQEAKPKRKRQKAAKGTATNSGEASTAAATNPRLVRIMGTALWLSSAVAGFITNAMAQGFEQMAKFGKERSI